MNAQTRLPSNGLRRAALALHALAPADRDWLLGRLPAKRRQELECLLAELAALGIPRSGDVVSSLAAGRAKAGAGELTKLLEGEPPGLVALASQAQDEAAQPGVPAALREALLQELAHQRPSHAGAPSPRLPLPQRWLARWQSAMGAFA